MAEKKKNSKVKKMTKKDVQEKTKKEKKFLPFLKKYKVVIIIVLVATLINCLVVYSGVKNGSSSDKSGKITAGYVHYWIEQSKADGAIITVFCEDGKKYCNEYEPVVRQIASDYKLPIYWVDLSSITDVEFQELIDTYKDLKDFKIPYTFITQKGKKVADFEGSVNSNDLIKTFTELGLISEE